MYCEEILRATCYCQENWNQCLIAMRVSKDIPAAFRAPSFHIKLGIIQDLFSRRATNTEGLVRDGVSSMYNCTCKYSHTQEKHTL